MVSLGAHTLSVVTLVVVSDGTGRHLGCSKAFTSLIYHLYSVRYARASGRTVKEKPLERPITKFTLAILVGTRTGSPPKTLGRKQEQPQLSFLVQIFYLLLASLPAAARILNKENKKQHTHTHTHIPTQHTFLPMYLQWLVPVLPDGAQMKPDRFLVPFWFHLALRSRSTQHT